MNFGDIVRKTKWLTFRFNHLSSSGKTSVWTVGGEGDNCIGSIDWYGRWRSYVFNPRPETIFEQTCLRDIAQFIEDENKAQRNKRRET